ncbi:MAG: VOC family protein [Myxococcota bacterium]
MGLELHVFVLLDSRGPARETLRREGLVETYERAHPGQGTANVCYAFDNAFVELLWIEDESDARHPRTARTRLWERSHHGCPFGICWRGEVSFETWDYHPQYLPQERAISVATLSDDPAQPMLFAALGKAPSTWPEDRQRGLQRASGFSKLALHISAPHRVPELEELARGGVFTLSEGPWDARIAFGEKTLSLAALRDPR